jgi:hypothetical protein
MKNLKKLAGKLIHENDESRQVKILQEMNEKLLTEYVIKISNNFIVYPLHVEAYYYHRGKFEDKNTHGSKSKKLFEKQSDRFGKLYFHSIGRGGVDICLSDGNYCLSFLIKASKLYIDDIPVFTKQIHLYKKTCRMKGTPEEESIVLAPDEKKVRNTKYVFHTVRKGLTEETFKEEKLAALTELEKEYKHTFAFEKGNGKEKIVRDFIASRYEFPVGEEIKCIMKNVLGYESAKILAYFGQTT